MVILCEDVTLRKMRCGLTEGGLGFNSSFSEGARGETSDLSME